MLRFNISGVQVTGTTLYNIAHKRLSNTSPNGTYKNNNLKIRFISSNFRQRYEFHCRNPS
ncbi:MAG: hypothetical protein MSA02_03755 [Bacteroidales bacterium]|nr:hypothetical protein [Bacteroidales bacterium]